MPKLPVFSVIVLVGLAIPTLALADTLIGTEGPFTWTDDCNETMQVTLRVYNNVDCYPGLYKWDYEVDNTSVAGWGGSSYGIGGLELWFPVGVPEIDNVAVPTYWSASAGGDHLTISSGYDSSSGTFVPLGSLQPGASMHFSFTTFPREIGTANACDEDSDGYLIEDSCARATKAMEFTLLAAPLRGQRPPRRRTTRRVSGGRSPRPENGSCDNGEISGEIGMPGTAVALLIQFGWEQTYRQDLWRSDTFASNGDSDTGSVVWLDPNGDGNPTTDDPAAFGAGQQGILKDVVLKTDPSFSGNATLYIDVTPNDFSFPDTQVTFNNGQATVADLSMASNFPNAIANQVYTFTMSLQLPGGDLEQFSSTGHQMYLMHKKFDPGDADRVTTTRLDYVTSLANGKSDAASVASAVQGSFSTQAGAGHLQGDQLSNPWSVMDSFPADGLDCLSLAEIAALELQQLGYTSVSARTAYPTGAIPDGDTDATTQESQSVANAGVFSLSFFNENYYEGFVYLSSDDAGTGQSAAVTIYPPSPGPFIAPTGCTVSPASDDNLLAFGVLTSAYRNLSVAYQEWYWDINAVSNQELSIPNPPSFGQIQLPANNCPSSEYP